MKQATIAAKQLYLNNIYDTYYIPSDRNLISGKAVTTLLHRNNLFIYSPILTFYFKLVFETDKLFLGIENISFFSDEYLRYWFCRLRS